MDEEIKRRLTWVRLYDETGDAGLVCRRCGISRPTLRKWVQRYREHGWEGLASQSCRPKRSPKQKVFEQEESWIRREYGCFLSLETIHKVLMRHPTPPVRRPRRPLVSKRYSMRLPGERAQMDTMKLAPGLYQYTFVDDCTRFLIAALYPSRTAERTVAFLDHVLEQAPFPIQRLQTDNGTEFMAYAVRDRLLELRIKHRPIPPRKPHLNGKVERAQKTALDEFYATTSLTSATLEDDLEDWLTDYNYRRVHGSLGVAPIDRWGALEEETPSWEDVMAVFDPAREATYVELLTLNRLCAAAKK